MTTPDWVGNPSYQPVHTAPPSSTQWESLTQDQIRVLRSRLVESIIQVVVQAVTGVFFPGGGMGGAAEQLTGWATDAADLVQGIIDNVWDAFDTGILGNTSGNPLEAVFDAVSKIFGTGTNAQSVNVIQDSRLDALVGGGSALSDGFDGAASSSLNATKWAQIYSGPGSGTCGLSGDGFCIWNISGGAQRGSQNIFQTATATDTQSVSISIGANISSGSTQPEIHIMGRQNLAGDTYIVARLTNSSADIGYVISNTYTRLGAAVSLSTSTSGTWQLKLGTAASNREFVLLHDGATVISRTDTGAASAMDASHRYPGFAIIAGWQFSIFFGFPVQVAPPPIGAWAASDVTP